MRRDMIDLHAEPLRPLLFFRVHRVDAVLSLFR